MHRTTVVVVLATIGIAVPGGVARARCETFERDGKKLRPFQQSFTFDNTRVTLDVDRNLVQTGDKVTATLRAYGPPRQVAIDLAVAADQQLRRASASSNRRRRSTTRSSLLDRAARRRAGEGDDASELGKRPSQRALTDSFRIFITQHGHKPEMTASRLRPEKRARLERRGRIR